MSTTRNNRKRSHQIALHDDPSEPDTTRSRARKHCFQNFLDYYDNASIRVHGTLAEQPDPWTVDSFTIIRELGNGTRLNLVECPIDGCHAPFAPGDSPSEHFLAEHNPEDVGLTPIQTPAEERTTTTTCDDSVAGDLSADELLVDDRELPTDNSGDDSGGTEAESVKRDDAQAALADW